MQRYCERKDKCNSNPFTFGTLIHKTTSKNVFYKKMSIYHF